jgi:hypothetical protein
MKYVLTLCCLGFIIGCSEPKATLSVNDKMVVGKLDDGREVVQYRVERHGSTDHYIYVVQNATVVTNNYTVDNGDTHRTEVHSVIIDDVKYAPHAEKE